MRAAFPGMGVAEIEAMDYLEWCRYRDLTYVWLQRMGV